MQRLGSGYCLHLNQRDYDVILLLSKEERLNREISREEIASDGQKTRDRFGKNQRDKNRTS